MSNDTPNTAVHTSDTPQLLLEHHLKELRLSCASKKAEGPCTDQRLIETPLQWHPQGRDHT